MDTLHVITLAVHNILRWVIVALAIVTLVQVYTGLNGKKAWTAPVRKAATFFTIALDTQLLVGLLLYFVFSPLTKAFFADMGASMSNATLRFFGMEHFLIMIVAIAFAHIGNAAGKKDISDQDKFRRAAIFFTLSMLLILAGIPWASRPLLPGI